MRISDWSSDVCSSDLRRLAHDEVAVGRIGDRSVDELTHAHGVHHRRHLPRVARQRLKAVEVLRQELAGELAGNAAVAEGNRVVLRSEEHTSELQALMRLSYAVFCLKKKKSHKSTNYIPEKHF